jgi:drug/metabolite transporter (DMT)-like permease
MDWLRITGIVMGALAVSFLLWEADFNLLPAGTVRDDIADAIADIGILLAIAMALAYYKSRRATRRERQAGYTTTYSKTERDLWLLDRRTGEVLARPGEPRTRRRGDRAGRAS